MVNKDRGALGNARIMGLQADLGLTGKQFYNCLMMFCKCTASRNRARANEHADVGYLVFELPAALSLRIFHPNWAYGTAVVIFGILATSMSAVRSYAPIMVIRVLLGLSEAWVQTGFIFLTLWYRREEMTSRAGTSPPIQRLICPS